MYHKDMGDSAKRIYRAHARQTAARKSAKKEVRNHAAMLKQLDDERRAKELRERAEQANEHICPVDD